MRAFVRRACRFGRDRRGATAIEYGLMLGFVALALLIGLRALAGTTSGLWSDLSTKVHENTPQS